MFRAAFGLLAIALPATGASASTRTGQICDSTRFDISAARSRPHVVRSVDAELPAGVWTSGQVEACAIVAFVVDERGQPVDAHVVEYSPWPAAGRAAIEALASYRFDAPPGTHLSLPFRFHRYSVLPVVASLAWHWKSLSSGVDSWTSRQGTATVAMVGGRFEALLIDDVDGLPAFTLKGTRQGDDIVVHAVVSDSDVPPINLTGAFRTGHWKDLGGGRESIVLTDGFEVIALTREIPVVCIESGRSDPIR